LVFVGGGGGGGGGGGVVVKGLMLECLVCVTLILSSFIRSFIHGDSVFDHCEEKRRGEEKRREERKLHL
jgi:hypothetical protein